MNKYKYLLLSVFTLLSFAACDDLDLPTADFERYQVEGVKATSGDESVSLLWSKQQGKPEPAEFLVIWTPGLADVKGGETTVAANVTELTIDNLVNDCKYTFSVQARYPKGLSQQVTATCTPKSTRIPASNFKVMAGDKRAYATWTAPKTSLNYSYKIDVAAGGSIVKSQDVASTETSCLIEQLTNDTEYTFSLTCVYSHGKSTAIIAKATPGDISPINVSVAQPHLFELCVFEYNPAYFVSGEIASVEWDFNDGHTATTGIASHCFTTIGEHKVDVNVVYTNGKSETATVSVDVVGFGWSSVAGVGYQKSSGIAFAPDGQTFYTASQTGKALIAIDAIYGTIKWEYTTADATYGAGPAVGADGTIYLGTEDNDGTLYAISPSGSLKWKKTLGGKVKASPAVTSDGTVYALADGGIIAAFDVNGNTKWTATESGNAAGVAVDKDGTVFFATNKGIFAYSETGTKMWASSEALNVTERGGSLAIHNGVVYATLKGKAGCAAVEASTGNVLWKYATSAGDCYHPVVDAEGTVYFCEKAGPLYAVDKSGNLKWKNEDGTNYIYNGFALAADGSAIISQYASPFSLLSINATGQSQELMSIGVQTMSPITLGPDNRIYYSTNGTIGTCNLGISAAMNCWPMRGGNAQGSNSLK